MNEVIYEVDAIDEEIMIGEEKNNDTHKIYLNVETAEWMVKELQKAIAKAKKSKYYSEN